MIEKSFLDDRYVKRKLSVRQIAAEINCSQNKVTYWLQKHQISRRTISEAIYSFSNPKGDPFSIYKPSSSQEWFLYGLGLGLFWGEGNKVNKHSVRLGNVDPALIKTFMHFLETFYNIDTKRLRFGLQVFSDVSPEVAKGFWQRYLQIPPEQFFKTVVTRSTKSGTYKRKNVYGVLTIYFSNSKLRDIIIAAIEGLQSGKAPHLPS